MLTTGLSTPGGLVANDRSRVALRVHFNVDGDADASAGGGGGGGGGGEAGGVAMVL